MRKELDRKIVLEDGSEYLGWGFGDTEEAVRKSVDTIAHHPVMPPHVRIAGFVMDSVTGELVQVTCP